MRCTNFILHFHITHIVTQWMLVNHVKSSETVNIHMTHRHSSYEFQPRIRTAQIIRYDLLSSDICAAVNAFQTSYGSIKTKADTRLYHISYPFILHHLESLS